MWSLPVTPGPVSGDVEERSIRDLDAAYAHLYRKEFTNVARTIHLIVHDMDRAEDITQEAFLQLHLHWSRIADYDRPDAWVRRVAIRLAMRGSRRDSLWAAVRGLLLPQAPAPESSMDVADAVRRLPRGQRAAIALHYYEDRPVAEIATLMGCAEATVKVHLHRGRKRLAELLGEEDDDAARP